MRHYKVEEEVDIGRRVHSLLSVLTCTELNMKQYLNDEGSYVFRDWTGGACILDVQEQLHERLKHVSHQWFQFSVVVDPGWLIVGHTTPDPLGRVALEWEQIKSICGEDLADTYVDLDSPAGRSRLDGWEDSITEYQPAPREWVEPPQRRRVVKVPTPKTPWWRFW